MLPILWQITKLSLSHDWIDTLLFITMVMVLLAIGVPVTIASISGWFIGRFMAITMIGWTNPELYRHNCNHYNVK